MTVEFKGIPKNTIRADKKNFAYKLRLVVNCACLIVVEGLLLRLLVAG